MQTIPIKRALLSVSDKTGIVELAKDLVDLGVELISTGGTSAALQAAAIPYRKIEELTGLPEMLDGRVKTLHPTIHGGILGRRDEHAVEAAKHHIPWIDLVVVNFYPFEQATKDREMTWDEVVEYIDVGGPTMVRAAAKNFAWVGVVVNPDDYTAMLAELRMQYGLSFTTRKNLAEKAFAATTHYDAMIHQYFLNKNSQIESFPQHLELHLEKMAELRYGENPHQRASAYQFSKQKTGILCAAPHQGKPLSYNNILDSEAAWSCVSEFASPACVIVKHANPCGAAAADTIDEAYQQAYTTDPTSAFGGIVALNRPCTKSVAEAVTSIFTEVILAPAFTEEALTVLATKPNLRVLEIPVYAQQTWEMKYITGGLLLQEKDLYQVQADELKIMTRVKPNREEVASMLFAWRVLKHAKSNAILVVKENRTLGIGAGQVSRIDAVDLALSKASKLSNTNLQNAVLTSDAFFPFRDSIDHIAQSGVRVIMQPGGSVRDEEVIAACDEHHIAMVFTGKRCFKH